MAYAGLPQAQLEQEIKLSYQGPIAIITINRPQKLNSLTQPHYYRISCLLRKIALQPEITATVLTGTGRFFSAGADVTSARPGGDSSANKDEERRAILAGFVSNNLDITRSFYQHPKILIGALNGPTVGLSAAFLGFCDFIYAAPHTYFLTPFSSLGLVTEGGASIGLVQRMGMSVANEALLTSRRIPCDKLVQCGFVNKVFSGKDEKDSDGFLKQVIAEVDDKLTGGHLNAESLAGIKRMIRAPYDSVYEAQGVREVMAGMRVFELGVPQKEFQKLASGQKRHKL